MSTPPSSPPDTPRTSLSSESSSGSGSFSTARASMGSSLVLSEPSQPRVQAFIQRIDDIQNMITATEARITVILNNPLTTQNPNIREILRILGDQLEEFKREKDRIEGEIPQFGQLLSEYNILQEGITKLTPPP